MVRGPGPKIISNSNLEEPPIFYCPSVSSKGSGKGKTPGSSRNKDKPLSLRVWLTVVVDGRKYPLRALVDTGAEVNIIRTGIIPHQSLQHDSHPLTLKGADDTCLKGGNLCVIGVGELVGHDIESQRDVHVQCGIHMYEANITVQAIISYKWLADQNFMVHPRRHGLYFQDENIQVFIPGIEKEEKEFTTRMDKVVAMKLEAVPVGFSVPHPLRPAGQDGTPTVVTGDTQRDPTPVHRSNEEGLGLAVAPYALGEPIFYNHLAHSNVYK